jgi:glutamate N-acetyltransferase/amino-acid N-acetyltransferase
VTDPPLPPGADLVGDLDADLDGQVPDRPADPGSDRRAVALPAGFTAHVANIGVKDDTDDLVVVTAERPVPAVGLFTQSTFAGPSVLLSRRHLADRTAQAVVVISKNANVATGPDGAADAADVAALVADRLGAATNDVVVTSTGVIGRRYPMDRIRAGIAAVPATPSGTDAVAVARGMMTTDTVPKVATAAIAGSSATVVGVAKGVGMIEPDMATHISVVLTDAELDRDELETTFRSVVDDTFNCVSIDTDTSTSDSSIILASGAAGPVDGEAFAAALRDVCLDLTLQIARDGEGAEHIIEVRVGGAADRGQARRIAKAIVNSPLVKTAVHGGDPNWGRVVMAIGKCSGDAIDQERVWVRFGDTEVYPRVLDDDDLESLSASMRADRVLIDVDLGNGQATATVWGCDLSADYVRINADYTT